MLLYLFTLQTLHRHMSKIINKVATALVYHLEWPAVTGAEVEAKELCSRFTVQSIANIGFGFEANTFNAAQTLEFFNMTKKIMPSEYRFDMWEIVKMMLVTFLPLLGKIFGFLVFFDKEATAYFFNIIKEQISKRKGQKEKRNDMIDLLTEALVGQSASDEDVKLQVEFSSAMWIDG